MPLFYTTFKNLFKILKLSCLEVSFAEHCIWRKSTIRGRKAVKSHYLSSSKNTDTNHTHKNQCFLGPQKGLLNK